MRKWSQLVVGYKYGESHFKRTQTIEGSVDRDIYGASHIFCEKLLYDDDDDYDYF